MTKPDYSHISVVLDRSGSMYSIKPDVIGGFNSFLEDQEKQSGTASITLCQFDDEFETVYSRIPIQTAPKLTDATFIPRGSTALLDAIGRVIQGTGTLLAELPEHERPSKVLIMIITDGFENMSREFKRDQIKAMMEHQREKYDWDFVFMGASEASLLEAQNFGFSASDTVAFNNDSAGTRSAFATLSKSVADYRVEPKTATKKAFWKTAGDTK